MPDTTPTSPLDAPVTTLPGIGPHRARVLAGAGVRTIRDVLAWYPRRYLDRSTIVPIEDLYRHADRTVTVIGRMSGAMIMKGRRSRLVVTLRDANGSMDLVFFQGIQFWQNRFTVGETLAVSGMASFYGNRPNMVHPEIDRLADEESLAFINTGGIIPVYPSSAELEKAGLSRTHGFRRLALMALERGLPYIEDPFASLPNVMSSDTVSVGALHAAPLHAAPLHAHAMGLRTAIETMHRPPAIDAVEPARRRLAFDEFFLLSMQLAYQRRKERTTAPGIAFRTESPLARDLVGALPFKLTAAQRRVITEISADMRAPEPMNRLLQGDVGSGKTVVALLAMLVAVDNQCQCALMVPTEILAEQHYRTLTTLVNDLRVSIRLLTGQQSQAQRTEILAGVAGGTVNILVGTHALIQDSVEFQRLGLVVIDEQHRFGVQQRASLRGKGEAPDVLVMTATPIPRTLAMTLYGDLDTSVIDELPAGRKRIRTAIRFEEDRDSVWRFLREEVGRGSQAYIVFPLVSESEKLDLRAATEEFETLKSEIFPDLRIGLLHGQMPAKEKDDEMQRFVRHELDILVTTTVIEVGVDVPNATVMHIEHAERFGLAQLHQLRGRVGRGGKQGYCVLMTQKRVFFGGGGRTDDEKRAMSDARRRLETMRDSTDGFRLAEIDMEIRGPGDLWGTMQSGFPELRVADLVRDGDILRAARDLAFRIVDEDPQLRAPEHEPILRLLGPVLRARMRMARIA